MKNILSFLTIFMLGLGMMSADPEAGHGSVQLVNKSSYEFILAIGISKVAVGPGDNKTIKAKETEVIDSTTKLNLDVQGGSQAGFSDQLEWMLHKGVGNDYGNPRKLLFELKTKTEKGEKYAEVWASTDVDKSDNYTITLTNAPFELKPKK